MEQKPIKWDKKVDLSTFKKNFQIDKIVDSYKAFLEELFLIRNPSFRFKKEYKEEQKKFVESFGDLDLSGEWFYFPWNNTLVHYLEEDMHQELRTARNRNLITIEEQKKFYNFNVAYVGLSVGSHAALTVAMMGGAKRIKIADPDVISGSNLNRIRYDFTNVGERKVDVLCRVIWQMNPYAEIDIFSDGINETNIENLFSEPNTPNVLIEGCDNLEMKIRLRIQAKKYGIPVFMGTDNGDNIIFDIERYDLDPELKIFNGVVGDLTVEQFKKMNPADLPKMATMIAGKDFVVNRMLESIFEVGKSLYSWPQLGSAASLCGAATAYVIRRLSLGLPISSGKMEVNLDKVFDPDYNSISVLKLREEKNKNLLSSIGL